MTPNQRLLVAVLLSVLFFAAYTAIFPAEQPEVAKTNTQIESAQKSQISNQPQGSKIEEETVANDLSTLVTINNSKFILKLDTLGRISSKVLLQDKYNNKEDQHAELIPATGTKPLFVRFLDSNLNE
ncbi:MAG: YidC/Oxa1 family rane protein insertase, partial [Campylobacterota bacterium]|nr:YidC/Oxa1 family rane protein insertase [Campylobacterota bacterium]